MAVAADMTAAAVAVAEAERNTLIAMAQGFGLPLQIAMSLRLEWDGTMFHARSSDPRLQEYEYGDGKRPPRAPVRKAMNRLRPLLLEAMGVEIDEAEFLLPEVRF